MEKILTLELAREKANELRNAGKQLVTVNGSFDIVHAGHLDQLEEAKKQGDVLFVGVNTDRSVKEAKGESRPLLPEQARAAMLAALVCVDFVVIIDGNYFDKGDGQAVPQILIRTVQPDVHVNGPDYGLIETWLEYPQMKAAGTKGYVVQKRNDLSTSTLIEKIKRSN